MNKSNLFLLFLLNASLMTAQQGNNGFLLSGSVIYEQTVKLDIQLEGEAAQFADRMPKERKSEKILHFTEEATLFENHQSEESEEPLDMHGGSTMMIKMAEPDNKLFTDLKKGEQIEQKEFMSRLFLIETKLEKGDWKMTGEQKMILEYPCMKATTSLEEKEVQAWFTPGIAIPAGPGKVGNLPGLVLEVDINEGEQVIVARFIELKEVEKELLKKPSKGKEVSEEEYHAIVEEKMKEMGVESEGGSGHTVVIKYHQQQ